MESPTGSSDNTNTITKKLINDMNLDVVQNIDELLANTSIEPAFKAFAVAKADSYLGHIDEVVDLISNANMKNEREAWLCYMAYLMIGYTEHAKNVLATIFDADVNKDLEKKDLVEEEVVEEVEGVEEEEGVEAEGAVEEEEAVEGVEAVKGVEEEEGVETSEEAGEAVETSEEAGEAEEASVPAGPVSSSAVPVDVPETSRNNSLLGERATNISVPEDNSTENPDTEKTGHTNNLHENPVNETNPKQSGGTRRKSKNMKRKSKKARKAKKARKP